MNLNADPFSDEAFVDRFVNRREENDSVNSCIDEPAILTRVAARNPETVLELGCATGHLTKGLASLCNQVVGIDRSHLMISRAQKETHRDNILYICSEFTEYAPAAPVDMVVSGMSMHLVADFELLCRAVYSTLKPGGTFLFSQRHPIRTCNPCGEGFQNQSPSWTVADYFSSEEKKYIWLGTEVTFFHRTLEEIFAVLTNTGFRIVELVEPRPAATEQTKRVIEHSNVPSVLMLLCEK